MRVNIRSLASTPDLSHLPVCRPAFIFFFHSVGNLSEGSLIVNLPSQCVSDCVSSISLITGCFMGDTSTTEVHEVDVFDSYTKSLRVCVFLPLNQSLKPFFSRLSLTSALHVSFKKTFLSVAGETFRSLTSNGNFNRVSEWYYCWRRRGKNNWISFPLLQLPATEDKM